MSRSITFLILFYSLLSEGLVAQSSDYADGVQITGMVQIGIPQNEFEEAYSGNPTGIGASIMVPVGKSKMLQFGGEYGWNSMGKEKTQVELSKSPEEIVAGDMTVSSDINSYHANMRFSPLKGQFRIYFDLLFGMKFYSTDTEIIVEQANGAQTKTTNSISSENTNFAGFAGGLMLALSRNFFIDAKFQSLQGGEVKYVDPNSLEINSIGDIAFEVKSTATDIIVPQVGLSIVF